MSRAEPSVFSESQKPFVVTCYFLVLRQAKDVGTALNYMSVGKGSKAQGLICFHFPVAL